MKYTVNGGNKNAVITVEDKLENDIQYLCVNLKLTEPEIPERFSVDFKFRVSDGLLSYLLQKLCKSLEYHAHVSAKFFACATVEYHVERIFVICVAAYLEACLDAFAEEMNREVAVVDEGYEEVAVLHEHRCGLS